MTQKIIKTQKLVLSLLDNEKMKHKRSHDNDSKAFYCERCEKEICCNLDVWGILVTVILQVRHKNDSV